MGNCTTNCGNCMGKDGEHAEFNMAEQTGIAIGTDNGQRGLGVAATQGMAPRPDADLKDYTKYLQQNVHMIIRLQSTWKGYRARRMISLLKAKQLGSSKYFTQEEARETVTKRVYNAN